MNTAHFNSSNQMPAATTVIAHEIGNTIGFHHTDRANISFSCGSGGSEGGMGFGVVHIPGTPTGPSQNSWMLACIPTTVDRPFTSIDLTALCNVYADFPVEDLYSVTSNRLNGIDASTASRRGVNCEDWANTRLLAYTSGYIFGVINGRFVRKDSNGATVELGSGWIGSEVMSSTNGFVFTIQGGNFWRTDINGNTISMGSGWAGAQAQAAMDGFVYTIQGGNFWKTNASSGATFSMGSGWTGAEAMAATSGFVYTVEGGNFWKTNASTGATTSLGSGWTGVTAMTSYSGNIYAVHQRNLYRITSNGAATLLSTAFSNTTAIAGVN